MTMRDEAFWQQLDRLVAASEIVIDRPRGSTHPRFAEFIYPFDYGYLKDTRSMDQGGIDVWVGSLADQRVTAVICTVDNTKRDAEIKILIGCTLEEATTICQTHNSGSQSGMLVLRPG